MTAKQFQAATLFAANESIDLSALATAVTATVSDAAAASGTTTASEAATDAAVAALVAIPAAR